MYSGIWRPIPALEDTVPRRSKYYCYRTLVTRERMVQHFVTAALIDNHTANKFGLVRSSANGCVVLMGDACPTLHLVLP